MSHVLTVLALLLATLAMLAIPAAATAQECDPPIDQAFHQASHVFVGTVTSSRATFFGKNRYRTRFHVDEAFKGTTTGNTYTMLSSSLPVGVFFREDARYLVYALDNELIRCGRTRAISIHSPNDEELLVLRSLAPQPLDGEPGSSAPRLVVFAAFLFVVLIGLFIVMGGPTLRNGMSPLSRRPRS